VTPPCDGTGCRPGQEVALFGGKPFHWHVVTGVYRLYRGYPADHPALPEMQAREAYREWVSAK